ncbi:MAG: hypothetical protein R3F35_22240 [Myxococcota bacterium]
MRNAWTLSPDRLFLDIAASHLDLHRPTGALKITKDDIEIRLAFDLSDEAPADRVAASVLPRHYFVEALAVGASTRGTLQAPWMSEPRKVIGRTWLIHSWTAEEEASLFVRRIDVFGQAGDTSFYGIQLSRDATASSAAWQMFARPKASPAGSTQLESQINFTGRWTSDGPPLSGKAREDYPVPSRFTIDASDISGAIRLSNPWLRFDPFEVIPQPFRWFVRRTSRPQEVWADTRIAVSIGPALANPSLPPSNPTERVSNSQREIEDETADQHVTGVASITFLNPIDRR